MNVNYSGCAICDSHWGDLWAEVEGTRLFFCCEICRVQLDGAVRRIKESAGWDRIDSLEISGDRSGRTIRATRGGESRRFEVAYNPEGRLRRFVAVAD